MARATVRAAVGHRSIQFILASFEHPDQPFLEFPEALRHLRSFHALDPRDKIYASLGLAKSADFIGVDYRKNVCEVYTSTTRWWIETSNDLHILDFCGPQSIGGLPTWLTDWARNNYIDRGPLYKRSAFGKDEAGLHLENAYSAGGRHALSVKFDDSSRILILRGISLDKVDFVVQASDPFTSQLSGTLDSMIAEGLYEENVLNNPTINDFIEDKTNHQWLRMWVET